MNTWAITALIILCILLGVGTYFVLRNGDDVVIPGSGVGTTTDKSTNTTTVIVLNSMIRVTAPTPGALVSSPLTITGEARGNWYFEASFPAKILDANGKLLGQMPIQAQGEWMTTEFVPFRASFTFATSTTPTGFLVLEKDNPSGLPQNAAEGRSSFALVAPDDVEMNHEAGFLVRKIRELPEPYSNAVYLRCVEELKPREISEILGESANVISVRISRGLEQLRSLLHVENNQTRTVKT
ncbi:MAG: Gmad2 immunoglobulin-like domain-containing protein [bacterium]|nr:Gmad2 immunoglobulin-like domain-containing protein [bacterium]